MSQITLPDGGLAELRRAIEETASSEGLRALREAGRRLAADAELSISRRTGNPLAGLGLERFWDEVGRYFEASGWGRIEHRPVNQALGSAVSSDWGEADPNEARSAPGCHISTGLLAELLTRAVGRPVAVMEVDCRSRGDEACRFLFGAPTTLLTLHRKLADSASLEEAMAALV